MPNGTDPNDIFHNGNWYSRTGDGPLNTPPNISIGKRTLVVTGDSYASTETHASATSSAGRGIFRNFNARLGYFFEIISITGIGGQTLAQIAARFSTDVLALSPGYVGILGGINSIVAGQTGAQMYATTKVMIDSAVTAGIIPIVLPAPLSNLQWGTVSAADQLAKVANAMEYNRLLNLYSIQKSGWLYASNAWAGVTDQAYLSVTYSKNVPSQLAAYAYDVSHLNMAGAFRVGTKELFNQFGKLFPISNVLPVHETDRISAAVNPLKLTTIADTAYVPVLPGAGCTGTPAQGYYPRIVGAGSSVSSQVARTDIAGAFWDQYVVSGLTVGSYLSIIESSSPAFSYNSIYHIMSNLGLVPGDIVEFYTELKMSGVTGDFNNITGNVYVLTSANALIDTVGINYNTGGTGASYNVADIDGSILVFASVRYTLPATADRWRWEHTFECKTTGASVAGTVSFGRCGWRKVG